MAVDLESLLLHRSEPDARAVLEDALQEQGRNIRSVMPTRYGGGGGGGYGGDGGDGDGGYGGGDGDGDGDGGGGGGGYGDGGYGDGGGGGYGDGGYGDGGGGGYGGDGDGGGGGGGDGGYGKPHLTIGEDMNNGLQIVCIPCGAYPYVLVGWVARVQGDEYDIHGARIIKRFGNSAALANLAGQGPQRDTKLLDASVSPERVHRLQVVRAIPCSEESWKKECPKPASWTKAVGG